MNEKVYKGIELTAATVASIGVDFIVTKAVTNLVKPETIPEKILTAAGVLGINLAVDCGISTLLHNMMYPNEDKKFEELAAQATSAIEIQGQFNEVLAKNSINTNKTVHEIYNEILNSPEQIVKNIMEGSINGRSSHE
jgi:hypothetical protein